MRKALAGLDRLLTTEQFAGAEILKMFLTLFLDFFFIYIINVLTTMMVSGAGEAAMAAVSLVGTLSGMVALFCSSMAAGGTIAVARARGRGDEEEIRKVIGEVTGVCLLSVLLLGGSLFAGADRVVRLLYPAVEPLVAEYTVRYLRLMCVSFLPYSVYVAIFNAFRNLGDTRSSLFLTVVLNLSHLFLCLLFINGLRLGVDGFGLSYIVARCIGMALALFWMLKAHNVCHVRLSHFVGFSRRVARDIFSLGMPLAVESVLLQAGMLLVDVYLSRLSTVDLAAHARANAILNLYQATPAALAALASAVCGRCYGADRLDLTRFYGRKLTSLGRIAMAFASLILFPLTPLLLRLYHVPSESVGTIRLCLGIAAVGMPLFAVDSNVSAMVLRVAGDGVFAGACAVGALVLGRCLTGYLLTLPLGLGVAGVWVALVLEWLLRSVGQRLRMRGVRWLHGKKPEA